LRITHRASHQPQQQEPLPLPPHSPPQGTSSKIDWDGLTPLAREAVESASKTRKAEWLVVEGKPIPGVAEKVWDGPWRSDDGSLGWGALPDTVDMPRMKDGSMLEWSNVNTKQPHEEGFLDVRPCVMPCGMRLLRLPSWTSNRPTAWRTT